MPGEWGIPKLALCRSVQTLSQQPEAVLKVEAEENISISVVLCWGEDVPQHVLLGQEWPPQGGAGAAQSC